MEEGIMSMSSKASRVMARSEPRFAEHQQPEFCQLRGGGDFVAARSRRYLRQQRLSVHHRFTGAQPRADRDGGFARARARLGSAEP